MAVHKYLISSNEVSNQDLLQCVTKDRIRDGLKV